MPHTVNLSEYRSQGAKVYAGRGRGEAARKAAGLNELDAKEGQVEVRIPDDVFSINSSFFLGMFGESIRRLGEEGFRLKYVFFGPAIDFVLDDAIREALRTSSPLTQATGNQKSP